MLDQLVATPGTFVLLSLYAICCNTEGRVRHGLTRAQLATCTATSFVFTLTLLRLLIPAQPAMVTWSAACAYFYYILVTVPPRRIMDALAFTSYMAFKCFLSLASFFVILGLLIKTLVTPPASGACRFLAHSVCAPGADSLIWLTKLEAGWIPVGGEVPFIVAFMLNIYFLFRIADHILEGCHELLVLLLSRQRPPAQLGG